MPDLYDYIDERRWWSEDEKTMTVFTPWGRELRDDEEGPFSEEPELTLKAKFEVCDNCGGKGSHSKHLGSFTMSEFDDAFPDYESRQDYFNGHYDMPCEICKGRRVMMVPDPGRNSKEDLEKWDKIERSIAEDRQMQIAEMRAGA